MSDDFFRDGSRKPRPKGYKQCAPSRLSFRPPMQKRFACFYGLSYVSSRLVPDVCEEGAVSCDVHQICWER